jgi:hypothetical protein
VGEDVAWTPLKDNLVRLRKWLGVVQIGASVNRDAAIGGNHYAPHIKPVFLRNQKRTVEIALLEC